MFSTYNVLDIFKIYFLPSKQFPEVEDVNVKLKHVGQVNILNNSFHLKNQYNYIGTCIPTYILTVDKPIYALSK